jgi:hypothetical protein
MKCGGGERRDERRPEVQDEQEGVLEDAELVLVRKNPGIRRSAT